MSAKIIDGKAVAANVISTAKGDCEALKQQGITPCLALILVGEDEYSKKYVAKKAAACEEAGIKPVVMHENENISEADLLKIIDGINNDKTIHGVLCQLPLPKHIDEQRIINAIAPTKDVDALAAQIGCTKDDFAACTPLGIIKLIESENIDIAGKNCVVVGRSAIVGKPTAMQLLLRDGTVTICHRKTKDLKSHTLNADIIVSAAGQVGLITADMVKPGAVIIDVANNRNSLGKLCGDVDFDAVKEVAGFITPVPGGVGPMTIAMLVHNTVLAAQKASNL